MFPLRREASGYAFKPSLHLHAKKVVCRDYKGGEMEKLPEAILQLFLFLLLLRIQEELLRILVPVGQAVSVHNTHAVNTVHIYLPEVADQKISLLLQHLF